MVDEGEDPMKAATRELARDRLQNADYRDC